MPRARALSRGREYAVAADASRVRLNHLLMKGMDEKDTLEFYDKWKASIDVRLSVINVLTNELNSALIKAEGGEFLSSPNYAALVADNAAYRRALRFAINLLDKGKDQDA